MMKLTMKDKLIFESIRSSIDKDFRSRVCIHQLELNYGINENKLRNGFRQQYGITIFAYQVQRQLAYALEQLKNPDYTIQEAAIRAGYKDISTFNRRFRKIYGTTPTEWRKQYMEEFAEGSQHFFPAVQHRAV